MDIMTAISANGGVPANIEETFFDYGPSNGTFYSILQGFCVILVINTAVELIRDFVRGFDRRRINNKRRIILEVFDQMHDPYKLVRMIAFRTIHEFRRGQTVKGKCNIKWTRLIAAISILFISVGIEVTLVWGSTPKDADFGPGTLSGITWRTRDIPEELKDSDVIIGSFSRPLRLIANTDRVKFLSSPSLTVERTDLADFGVAPSSKNILNCTANEGWRFLCKIRTKGFEYNYKVRIDLSTERNEDFFFVRTKDLDFNPNNSRFPGQLIEGIAKVLKRRLEPKTGKGNDFYIPSNGLHLPDFINITGKIRRTHDVIASFILKGIQIETRGSNFFYSVRKKGEREVRDGPLAGILGRSGRPKMGIITCLLCYVGLTILSTVLHSLGLQRGDDDIRPYVNHRFNNCGSALLNIEVDSFVVRVQKNFSLLMPEQGLRQEPNIHISMEREDLVKTDENGNKIWPQGRDGWTDIDGMDILTTDLVN